MEGENIDPRSNGGQKSDSGLCRHQKPDLGPDVELNDLKSVLGQEFDHNSKVVDFHQISDLDFQITGSGLKADDDFNQNHDFDQIRRFVTLTLKLPN
jgi:hypothetical protein